MRKEAAQEWRINMRNRFDRQLVQLNDELIEMGGMIEKAIADTVKALVNQDTELAKVVIDYDEEIDHQEREIEQLCLKLLLQQQPVARDLRLISSALKVTTLLIFQRLLLSFPTSLISRSLITFSRWLRKLCICLCRV